MREPKDGEESSIRDLSREGTGSIDIVLVDSNDSRPFSLPTVSSSSSGGLSGKSRGLLPNNMLNSFSDTFVWYGCDCEKRSYRRRQGI